jgi:hypothetical protein
MGEGKSPSPCAQGEGKGVRAEPGDKAVPILKPQQEANDVKYMLLIYQDEQALDAATRDACYQESTELAHRLAEAGKYLAASPLQSTATATSVRVRDGKRFVTDGPFAETREQLGGYFLVDANDLDEAIAIAGQIPGARFGTVEVRPVFEIPNLPRADRSTPQPESVRS